MRAVKATLRGVFSLGVTLLLVAIVALLGLAGWLATGERSLDSVKPALVKELNAGLPDGYSVDFGGVLAQGKMAAGELEIRLTKLLLTNRGKTVIQLPELKGNLDIMRLFAGQWRLASVRLTGLRGEVVREWPVAETPKEPDEEPGEEPAAAAEEAPPVEKARVKAPRTDLSDAILPSHDAQWRVRLGQEGEDVWPLVAGLMEESGKTGGDGLPVGKIVLESMRWKLSDSAGRAPALGTPEAVVELTRTAEGNYSAKLVATLHEQKADGSWNPEAFLPVVAYGLIDDGKLKLKWQTTEHALFTPLIPWLPEVAKPWADLEAPIGSQCELQWDRAGERLDLLDCRLQVGEGRYRQKEWFDKAVRLDGFDCRVSVKQDGDALEWRDCAIRLKGHKPTVTEGRFRLADGLLNLEMSAQAEGFTVQEVVALWPKPLAEEAREWVRDFVRKGLGNAEFRANITDYAVEGEAPLPKDSLLLKIHATGGEVDYFPPYPAVTSDKVEMLLDAHHFTALAEEGQLANGVRFSGGSAVIGPFHADDLAVRVRGKAEGEAAAMFELLTQEPIFLDKLLEVDLKTDPKALAGQVKSEVDFSIPLLSEELERRAAESFAGVTATAKGSFTGVRMPPLLGRFAPDKAEGEFMLDNSRLELKTKGSVNGSAGMDMRYVWDFAAHSGKAEGSVTGLPVSGLQVIGLPPLAFLSGEVSGTGTVVTTAGEHRISVVADTRKTVIHLPELGIDKEAGEAASTTKLAMTLSRSRPKVEVSNLEWNGDRLLLKASGTLDIGEEKPRQQWVIGHLVGGQQDLSGTVEVLPRRGRYNAKITARRLDVAYYWQNRDLLWKEDDDDTPLRVDISGKADRLLLGEVQGVEGVSFSLQCNRRRNCYSGSFEGVPEEGKPVYVSLGEEGEERILRARTEDMGALARLLDITETMKGGQMDMKATLQPTRELSMQGMLLGSDYRMTNTPLLTKLLSVASPTGLLELLGNKGVAFGKLTIPFNYKDGELYLKGGKTHGLSMGLTFDGMIDINKDQLHLEGAVVPSYAVNNILGNVPILGNLLQGGEGKGLFAMNYQMKGTIDDPSVTVNPLSILTPGFLRGLFDIVDPDKPKDDSNIAVPEEPASGKND